MQPVCFMTYPSVQNDDSDQPLPKISNCLMQMARTWPFARSHYCDKLVPMFAVEIRHVKVTARSDRMCPTSREHKTVNIYMPLKCTDIV